MVGVGNDLDLALEQHVVPLDVETEFLKSFSYLLYIILSILELLSQRPLEQHVVARPHPGHLQLQPRDQFAIEVERPIIRRPARLAPPPPIGAAERRLRLQHQAMFGPFRQ